MGIDLVVTEWISRWSADDAQAFAALYAPHGEYLDAAFGIRRSGNALIATHHAIWWRAIPDFHMELAAIKAAPDFAAFETICTGTFSGEAVGGGKLPPTMKPFRARTMVMLEVNGDGLIERTTEYYDRATMPGGEPTPFGQY